VRDKLKTGRRFLDQLQTVGWLVRVFSFLEVYAVGLSSVGVLCLALKTPEPGLKGVTLHSTGFSCRARLCIGVWVTTPRAPANTDLSTIVADKSDESGCPSEFRRSLYKE